MQVHLCVFVNWVQEVKRMVTHICVGEVKIYREVMRWSGRKMER